MMAKRAKAGGGKGLSEPLLPVAASPFADDSGKAGAADFAPPPVLPPPSAPAVDAARRMLSDLAITAAAELPTIHPNVLPENSGDGKPFRIQHVQAPRPDPLLAAIQAARNECGTKVGGTIIPQGQFAFTVKNGIVGYLAPGRRRIWDPLRKVHNIHNVNQDVLSCCNVTFVYVRPGQIGLALHQGVPVVLEVGRHMIISPVWQLIGVRSSLDDHVRWPAVPALNIVRVRPGKIALIYDSGKPLSLHHRREFYEFMAPKEQFVRIANMMQDVIRFDDGNTLDIIRVRPGQVGLLWQDQQPAVLPPSEVPYELRAPRQQFVKIADALDEEIRLDSTNSLDIIRVRPGKIGLLWEDGRPRLLAPRSKPYVLRKPHQQFVKISKVNEEHIELGSLHIITIATGRRAVAWIVGRAIIIEAGQSVFEEDNFIYGKSHNISEKMYSLGPYTYITVGSGEVGIKHTCGELEVLYAGTHCLSTNKGETFHGFVSVQQQVMKVRNLKVITLDNVELRVDAVLTYSIKDPEMAIRGVKNLDEVLRQRTETTLSNIFSHNNYGQKGRLVSTAAVATTVDGEHDMGLNGGGNIANNARQDNAFTRAADFIEKHDNQDLGTMVHDEFMSLIKSTASNVWGVDIGDMSVDNIVVVNEDLAHDLEQRAVTTVKTATQRANAENAAKVELIKAEANARAKALEAQGDTAQAIAQAQAQAQIIKSTAEATAHAAKIEAQGKAEALRIMSVANAEARVTEAEAEKTATRLEAEGMEALGKNAMCMRQWQTQIAISQSMFKNQRTFVDSSGMPTMAELLNLNMLNKMGLGPSGPPQQLQQQPKGDMNGQQNV